MAKESRETGEKSASIIDDRSLMWSPAGDELRIIPSGEGYILQRWVRGEWVHTYINEYAHTIFGKLCEMMAEAGYFDQEED